MKVLSPTNTPSKALKFGSGQTTPIEEKIPLSISIKTLENELERTEAKLKRARKLDKTFGPLLSMFFPKYWEQRQADLAAIETRLSEMRAELEKPEMDPISAMLEELFGGKGTLLVSKPQ